MKQGISSTADHSKKPGPQPGSRASQAERDSGPGHGHLTQLIAAASDSPMVQAQRKLAGELQGSSKLEAQMWLGAEINRDVEPSVVQAKLELAVREPEPSWYEPISLLIVEYNKALSKAEPGMFSSKETERRLALSILQKIETWTYGWFHKLDAPDIYMTPYGSIMGTFLNAVQEERVKLVSWSLKKEDAEPPVANFEFLEKEQKILLVNIWKQLVKSKTVIQGDSAFRLRVLTDFSRLLETQTGRTLVGEIVAQGDALQIKPAKPTAEGGKFAASPDKAELEEIAAIDEPVEEERQHYARLDFTNDETVEERKLAIHNARTNFPKAKGIAVVSGEGTRYFRFNQGTSSTLSIPPDAMHDSTLLASSRGVGMNDEEILAPSYINLGHELGHVLRSLQGVSANVYGGKALIQHAFPNVHEEIRPEEFFNIDAVENQLRSQSGLSRRKGHGNWTGKLTQKLMNDLLAIRGIIDKLREAHQKKTKVLELEILKTLDVMEEQCNDLTMPLAEFSKQGGNPLPLMKKVEDLSIEASKLPAAPKEEVVDEILLKRRGSPDISGNPVQKQANAPGENSTALPDQL